MNSKNRQLVLFILVGMFLGATSGMYETSFNNFLNDTYHVSAEARGILEFPRELPGFLVALMSGLLFFLVETRMAVVAAMFTSLGLIGLGHFSPSYGVMTAWLIVWSIGTHLYMPLGDSMAVAVSPEGQVGKTMGMIGGVATFATIAGCGVVWLGTDFLNLSYRFIFTLAGMCAAGAAVCLLSMDPKLTRPEGKQKPLAVPRFVFKGKYSLFYWLNILFGARKQVFITFGPWVLIKVFDQPASIIAKLWIASAMIGIVFKPLLGRMIDSLGERFVLRMEAVVLVFICAGYGLAEWLSLGHYAVWMLYACYVGDQLMFSVGMARTTYISKIVESKEDLMPTLSMGVSINHIVSMLIPMLGGSVWVRYGYQWVFVGAAAVAVANFVVAGFVRIKAPAEAGDMSLTA